MIKKKYKTRKNCIHYNTYGKPCGRKMGTWHCQGVTKCLKYNGWFRHLGDSDIFT